MHIIHHGRIFASILILIIAHSLCAQPYQVSPIEKNFADTIPIELYNNLIILPVAINEKDHRFIFDTGCTVSMISPEVLLPDYEVVRRDTISDVNGERKEMSFVKVCEVSIGKLHFPCYPMLSYSFKDMSWKCAQIDGVVGGDILQSLIVKIDTQHKRLILTDRKKWFKKEKGYGWQSLLIPYGRMSLTNYISQSIMGVIIYYGFGLAMYKYAGATASLLIALLIFTVQLIFSRWWLARHKQGPLEFLWRKGTWI